MSVNSSSSLNFTFVSPTLPLTSSSILSFYLQCSQVMASVVMYSLYTFTNILILLPLYIFILLSGYQRLRQQTTSHSDILTYHIVAVELFGVVGSFFCTLDIFINNFTLFILGILTPSIIFPGQTLFHCLACLERYLAVVHPVIYIRLRDTGGVKIRNISIVCVWLLCFGWVGVTKAYLPNFPAIPLLSFFVVSLIFISFCSLSVLFVLMHPRPGDVSGDKERVDQSKQRAFCIIMAITGALLLRFLGVVGSFSLYHYREIKPGVLCVLTDFGIWLTVPSSLVLPLLFLHKTGKLVYCRRSAFTRQGVK